MQRCSNIGGASAWKYMVKDYKGGSFKLPILIGVVSGLRNECNYAEGGAFLEIDTTKTVQMIKISETSVLDWIDSILTKKI